eukprot:CAMPEP_0171172990 /NCGR_PEP_ID=MMETSP0790-20130122/9996_1 /TAXON_ID=2925 /ORGANISM="Alexandrium catenella, Strain OF101" /LENGTH=165 /DNA_ID=CAMNT_0011637849 /DNA_START=33 /DNA_END=527 /DNA_ORIENTATION=+
MPLSAPNGNAHLQYQMKGNVHTRGSLNLNFLSPTLMYLGTWKSVSEMFCTMLSSGVSPSLTDITCPARVSLYAFLCFVCMGNGTASVPFFLCESSFLCGSPPSAGDSWCCTLPLPRCTSDAASSRPCAPWKRTAAARQANRSIAIGRLLAGGSKEVCAVLGVGAD